MKNYYSLLVLCLAIVSCNSSVNVIEEPNSIFKIYQVTGNDAEIVTVEVEDFTDGFGIINGKLVFNNQITSFDAIYDYVDDVRTNFSIKTTPESSFSGMNIHGSGFYTSDSIDIIITQENVAGVFQEHFSGTR